MRSYCLYNGNYIDIAEIFEVVDGKQINIPEKLDYYRKISDKRQLFCACGCGGKVTLVAGEKNLRKQHFRWLHQFAKSNCEYQEESDISIKSKIILRCWLNKNFPILEHEIKYRVPISQLTDNRRRYELSMYSKDYDMGIVYYNHISNILEKKIELLSEYMKSNIIYVTGIENEKTNGQYPEHMMRIQEAQGYCFYLDFTSKSLYEEVKAKVSIYVKTYHGLWKSLEVCQGMLNDFGLNTDGTMVYNGELISNLMDKKKKIFQKEQEYELEQRKMREEAERLRLEKEIQKRKERIILQEERKQQEVEKQKEREKKQRLEEEKIESFFVDYPKCTRVYELLKNMKCIKGIFDSVQGNGRIRNYQVELEVEKLKLNREKHRIEITGLEKLNNQTEKVYVYILENGFCNVNIPKTGVLYKVIDYMKISDIEGGLKKTFICIFKEGYNDSKIYKK